MKPHTLPAFSSTPLHVHADSRTLPENHLRLQFSPENHVFRIASSNKRRHVSISVRHRQSSTGQVSNSDEVKQNSIARRRDVLVTPLIAIGACVLRSAVARAEEKAPDTVVPAPVPTVKVEEKKAEVVNSRIYDATVIGEPMALGKDKGKVWEKLMNARVVYLGEAEQVPTRDDKELELEILRSLKKRCVEAERPISLAFEAFPSNLQEQLDQYMDRSFPKAKDMEKFRRGFEISCCCLLPEDLMIEILLMLPVESLLRSKAVCKYWYNVITSSDFIKNHFNHRLNNDHARILVYHSIPSPPFELGFAVFSDESLARHHHELDYLRIPYKMEDVLGPVNGLFLLCLGKNMQPFDNHLSLLNPATRELRPLIVPDASQEPHLWSSCHTFGFGPDPLTNDFKVVAFWDFDDRRTGFPIGLINIAVYSLANDSWKHLDPLIRHNSPCALSGTAYFSGACHWLSGDFNSGYSLFSFDLGGEVLREINGPQNTLTKLASLFVYKNESLAMFLSAYGISRLGSIELMIMKKEGCWTKQLTVDVSLLGAIRPLGVWKNNKLFLETSTMPPEDNPLDHLFYRTRTKVVLYDPTIHETKEFGIHHSEAGLVQVFSYNESLVSLKRGHKDQNRYSFSDLIKDFCSLRTAEVTQDYFWCEECMIDRARCTCGNFGDRVEEEDEYDEWAVQQQN